MIAAASVNWHYLLILIVPSLFVIVFTALTWYSRSRRPPGGPSGSRGAGGESSGQGGRSSGGGKSSGAGKSPTAGGKSSGSAGKRSGSAGKRRRA